MSTTAQRARRARLRRGRIPVPILHPRARTRARASARASSLLSSSQSRVFALLRESSKIAALLMPRGTWRLASIPGGWPGAKLDLLAKRQNPTGTDPGASTRGPVMAHSNGTSVSNITECGNRLSLS